jgi:hypothetical protein
MRTHFLQRQNETEGAWRQSLTRLVATLNDPNLITVVLFCLIALLVTAGGLRWELQRSPHAALEPRCFVHTCFDF